MEQATGVFPLCTLTRPNGSRCAAAALPGSNFCFEHIGGSVAALTRANKPQRQPAKIQLAYPGDRPSLQHNLHLIAQALSDGKIDVAEANAYNRLYRTAELNLRRWQAEHPSTPLVLSTEATNVGGDQQIPGAPSLMGAERASRVAEQQPPALAIPTEATEAGVPTDRSSSAGWEGSAAERPAVHNADATTSLGGPLKRSLSGDQQIPGAPSLMGAERASRVGEQQPPPLVIPTEATEAGVPTDRSSSAGWEGSAAERPAFPNAGTTTNTVPEEEEEEEDQPWPSPEIAYRTYERLRKRYAEKLAAEEQEAEKQEAERKNQPPAA